MSFRKFEKYVFILVVLAVFGCSGESDRKIKLAHPASEGNAQIQTASSILDLTPVEQHPVVILPFVNETSDSSLDWLSRGLVDMLSSKLSQSHAIRVVDLGRFQTSLNSDFSDESEILRAARELKVHNIVSGIFEKDRNGLRIFAIIRDVPSANVLKKEVVHGASLERIFSMVDELANRIRNGLQEDLESESDTQPLTAMTQSLEAFRCYSKALAHLDAFAHAEAEKCLSQALNADTSFAKAYLLLSKIQLRMGQVAEAQKALSKARHYSERLSEQDRLWLRLYSAELSGDISELVTALKGLLHFEANDPEARMELAHLHFGLKDYEQALAEYEAILELDPGQKVAYNHLGYIHGYRGDFTSALRYLDRYAELAPDEPNPYDSRGEILMMSGRLREAVEQFQMALQRRPNFIHSLVNLCEIHSELGDQERALHYFDKYLGSTRNPRERAQAHLKRAAHLWRFGKIEAALQDIHEARELAPNTVHPVLLGAEMYKFAGDTAAAQRLYKSFFTAFNQVAKGRELDPYEIETVLLFGMEADLPQDKLIALVERLWESESRELHKMQYEMLLSILYLRNGDYEKAERHCGKNRDEFFALLTELPNRGRSSVWKYSVETIELEPIKNEPDLSFVDKFLSSAKQAGRKDLEVLANLFYAQYDSKYGRRDEVIAAYRKVGVPLEESWTIIGPFENRSGFERSFPPEEKIDLNAVYRSGKRTLKWQSANDGVHDGYVDLRAALQPSVWAVGYGVVYIHSPSKKPVQFRIASDEACKLWLNDSLVWQVYRSGDVPLDHDIVSVVLRPGDNKLLIKVTNSFREWGYYLRVTDEYGNGIKDIEFRRPQDVKSPVAMWDSASPERHSNLGQ